MGPNQIPIQCYPEILSEGLKRPDKKLTLHLNPMMRFRIKGKAIPVQA